MSSLKKSQNKKLSSESIGWSLEVVKRLMNKREFKKFNKWMVGQTCPIGPNGEMEYYWWDVLRFLAQERKNFRNYWD